MQIVIDVPDKYMKGRKVENGSLACEYILEAVYNGTPLPKGHGRLIDADELKKHKYHDSDRHENAVSVAQIDWQPTIIEADKAGEKE